MTYDKGRADKAIAFISRLKQSGENRGKPVVLAPYQIDFIQQLFGRVDEEGNRIVTDAFLFLPRRQGKSFLIAALVVYFLFGEGRGKQGMEIYSAATNRDQAGRIFKYVSDIIRQNPHLAKNCRILSQTKKVIVDSLDNEYQSLSSDESSAHSLNCAVVIADELHAWKKRELFDTLHTGFGNRTEYLFCTITTAGANRYSVCYEEYLRAKRAVDAGNPSYLGMFFERKPEQAWDDENTWHECMPALQAGFCKLKTIRDQYEACKHLPARQAVFKQLYLNEWQDSAMKWLDNKRWEACYLPYDEADLYGLECVGAGLDLASTRDISSLVLLFADGDVLKTLSYNWIPGVNAIKRESDDKVPYRHWASLGHITLTDGDIVDYEQIRADINRLNDTFRIRTLAIDPFIAPIFGKQLENDGVQVAFYRQTQKYMNAPCKKLETLLASEPPKIAHNGNEVLKWAVNNVSVEIDSEESIKPSKKKSNDRIDPVVALVMALGVSMNADSQFLERGIITI